MGKRYKIKRAVRMNPEIWRDRWGVKGAKYLKENSWDVRYNRKKPGWQPAEFWYEGRKSYKSLVKRTLRELGK